MSYAAIAIGHEDDEDTLGDSKDKEGPGGQKWMRRHEWVPAVRSRVLGELQRSDTPAVFFLGGNEEMVGESEREKKGKSGLARERDDVQAMLRRWSRG